MVRIEHRGFNVVVYDIAIFSVFYHLCYEGNVDLRTVDDLNDRHALEVQIMEFGQIPKQVFTVPHPQRKRAFTSLPELYQTSASEPLLNGR